MRFEAIGHSFEVYVGVMGGFHSSFVNEFVARHVDVAQGTPG